MPIDPPLADVGRLRENVGFLAARFSYVAAKAAGAALAPLNLSTRRYTVLELATGGDGLPQRELGRILCLDPSNVLRLVDRLEGDGLVERVRDPEDRRRTLIRATNEGRELATRAGDALARAEREILAPLSDEDRRDTVARLQWLGLETQLPD